MKEVSKLLLIFCLIFFDMSCRGDRSKAELNNVIALCDNRLFVETYMIFNSGAYGGDKVSGYLTDSTNFRKYIGTFDNGINFYSFVCKGDSVDVYYGQSHSPQNKIISIKPYLISDLKKEGKFE